MGTSSSNDASSLDINILFLSPSSDTGGTRTDEEVFSNIIDLSCIVFAFSRCDEV